MSPFLKNNRFFFAKIYKILYFKYVVTYLFCYFLLNNNDYLEIFCSLKRKQNKYLETARIVIIPRKKGIKESTRDKGFRSEYLRSKRKLGISIMIFIVYARKV